MARRSPLGAKASPPMLDGSSSTRSTPLPLRAKACLPADQATVPSRAMATRSIQRRLASVATVSDEPSAPVLITWPSSPPVTTRRPSQAAARMAPACTAIRLASPSRAASSSASSPSTNTAASPRKCTSTTAASALTGRVRSTTEAVSLAGSLTAAACRSGDACGEARADVLLGQIAADEDDAAQALLVCLPRALMIAVEDHVHALEDEAVGIVLEGEDALGAQDARPLLLH